MTCTLEAHRGEITNLLDRLLSAMTGPAPQDVQRLTVDDPALAQRVLATAVHAPLPIPTFTNSQMDGYAARSADLAGASADEPVILPLGFTAAAGDPQLPLAAGTVSPVMTGAALPQGADTVIPVEESLHGAFPELVRPGQGEPTGTAGFTAPSAPGRFVRFEGANLAAGALLAPAGTRLTPTWIGALAASGVSMVPVRRALRLLVCTTGNELAAGQPGAGQIPDANSPMLAALLRGYGVQVVMDRLPDDPQRLSDALDRWAASVDVILTVGGISAGAYEVVREALTPRGGTFHHVAMQPGGPQGFATLADTPVLCFPGNPVSALLSTEVFLAPHLRRLAALPEPAAQMLELAHAVDSPLTKHQIRRAVITDGLVTVLDPGSHLVHDLARAEALVHLPVGVSRLEAGTPIETWSMNV